MRRTEEDAEGEAKPEAVARRVVEFLRVESKEELGEYPRQGERGTGQTPVIQEGREFIKGALCA